MVITKNYRIIWSILKVHNFHDMLNLLNMTGRFPYQNRSRPYQLTEWEHNKVMHHENMSV